MDVGAATNNGVAGCVSLLSKLDTSISPRSLFVKALRNMWVAVAIGSNQNLLMNPDINVEGRPGA